MQPFRTLAVVIGASLLPGVAASATAQIKPARIGAAESLWLVAHYAPPFENLRDEKAPGLSVKVLREVFADMGQASAFEAYPNRRGWTTIARGEGGGIFSGARLGE